LYLARFISYEASYYLNKKLIHLQTTSDGKLLNFVAFKSYLNKIPCLSAVDKTIDLMIDGLSADDYQKKLIEYTKL
jgi:para-aminobenzoate synthetase/4-amino-4-deoxychorismate lyase